MKCVYRLLNGMYKVSGYLLTNDIVRWLLYFKPTSEEILLFFFMLCLYIVEWQDFNQTYGLEFAFLLNNTASKLFKPPILTNIALHPLPYKNNISFSPALNATFKIQFLGKASLPGKD